MSNVDEELESLSHDVFHPEALAEIARAKEKNPSMFVSGWIEDDDAGVTEATDIDENPISRLLWASEHGKRRIIRQILADDPSLINVQDRDGYTPLHRASYNDFPKTIQVYLEGIIFKAFDFKIFVSFLRPVLFISVFS
ncbi:unnamed protein product [Soboliphyme baturini]|uniref:ANK_REP_REGION domain-containing protein n=1 Tax=Soboliphyme baturini TaxID=241478 RepID=A0A183IHP4_9BILA|nr:unnamed protein product [Soboliphyme baturini]